MQPASPQMPLPLPLLVCCILVLASVSGVSGQGYNPPPNLTMGASNRQQALARLLASSGDFVRRWSSGSARASCKAGTAKMCAPAGSTEAERQAALMLATSPSEFASTRLEDTPGQTRVIADAEDQGDCNTCTAIAVVAAAQAAVSTVLQVDVDSVLLSSQDLYFCSPQDPRTCSSGWSFVPGAVAQLVSRQLLARECLAYNPSPDPFADTAAQCVAPRTCNTPNAYAAQGKFASQPITNVWEAQRFIRQYGAVVTSFQVMSDLRPFFSKGNARAVYSPSSSAKLLQNHAVVLVGYKNNPDGSGHWLALNSWSKNWADNGTFRVAFGCCGILADAYAVTWSPNDPSLSPTLQPRAPAPNNCYLYTARRGDYLSRIAQRGGVRLEQFLLDNIAIIDDLSKPLVGKKLLVCPSTANRAPAPAKASAPAPATSGCASGKLHVVKSGDSLWIIANTYGTTLEDVVAANPQIKNPDLIFPGQKVCLP